MISIPVTWFLAPLEDEDGLRQKIGNSMFIIIYNDCDEPFNPSNVYLGQITTVVCVVQKTTVLDTLLDPAVPKYRCQLIDAVWNFFFSSS